MRPRSSGACHSRAPRAPCGPPDRTRPRQAANLENLGTALLNLGNAAGGAEAVQLYVHARACFRLALAQLGGGAGGGGVEGNLGAVEGNCRRRYRRLCEELPEAHASFRAGTALAEDGPLAHVSALLLAHRGLAGAGASKTEGSDGGGGSRGEHAAGGEGLKHRYGSGHGVLQLEASPEAVSADPLAQVAASFDASDAAAWPSGQYAAAQAALARLKVLLMDAGYHQAAVMDALQLTHWASFRPEAASAHTDGSLAKTQAALQAFESGETRRETPWGRQRRAELAYLVRLFFCRLRIEPGLLLERLGRENVVMLEDGLGLLARHDDGTMSSRVQVTPMLGDLHIFTDWQQTRASLTVEPVMYLGADSQALAWAQPRTPAQQVLDLCCGSGVQGIVAARYYATNVVFVDFNPRAVRFTRLNLAFNGLARKGTVLLGDLYSALENAGVGRFDVILANPPYLPVAPDDIRQVAYGDGGPDGERIIKRIIQSAPLHLSHTGRVHIVSNLMNPNTFERKLWAWWTANLSDRWQVDSQGFLDKYARAPKGNVAAFHLIRGDIWSAEHYQKMHGPSGLKVCQINRSPFGGQRVITPRRRARRKRLCVLPGLLGAYSAYPCLCLCVPGGRDSARHGGLGLHLRQPQISKACAALVVR